MPNFMGVLNLGLNMPNFMGVLNLLFPRFIPESTLFP